MIEETNNIHNENENTISLCQDETNEEKNIILEKQEIECGKIIKEEIYEIKENIINENVTKEEDQKEISTEEISSEIVNSDKEKNESEIISIEENQIEVNKNLEEINNEQQKELIINEYPAGVEQNENDEKEEQNSKDKEKKELNKEKMSQDSIEENNIYDIHEKIKTKEQNEIYESQFINKIEKETNEKPDINVENSIVKDNDIISESKCNEENCISEKNEEKEINYNTEESRQAISQKLLILDDKSSENKCENKDIILSNQKTIKENEVHQTNYINKKADESSAQNSSIKDKILQFDKNRFEGKKPPEKKQIIQKKLNKNILDKFNGITQEPKEEKPKIIIKRLNLNEYIPDKGKEKVEERTNKFIPKKIDKKRIEALKNYKNEKEIISKNTPPKKFNADAFLEKMIKEHYQPKVNNNQEEKKEIKKFNGDEYLKKMQEDELLRQAKLEIIKITPKKKFDDDYFKELEKSRTKVVIIRRKTPRKINGEEKLIKMKEAQKILDNNNLIINKDKDSFCELDIKDRDNNKVSQIVSNINEREAEIRKFEEEKKSIELKKAKKIEEMKKREKERKIREEEEKKRRREELRIKREKEEKEQKQRLNELRIKREKEEEERKKKEEEEKKRKETEKKRK